MIKLTKEFTFEMAHALTNHDGKCKNIHGHSYHLAITVVGKICREQNHSKEGMIIDFSDLKKIINTNVIDVFDHSLVLKEGYFQESFTNEKIMFVPYQPTCENLLCDFVSRIEHKLPPHCALYGMKLRETPTSYAEWVSDSYVS